MIKIICMGKIKEDYLNKLIDDYKKRISEEEFVIKTAFEVSVSKIDTADVNTNQEEDE